MIQLLIPLLLLSNQSTSRRPAPSRQDTRATSVAPPAEPAAHIEEAEEPANEMEEADFAEDLQVPDQYAQLDQYAQIDQFTQVDQYTQVENPSGLPARKRGRQRRTSIETQRPSATPFEPIPRN